MGIFYEFCTCYGQKSDFGLAAGGEAPRHAGKGYRGTGNGGRGGIPRGRGRRRHAGLPGPQGPAGELSGRGRTSHAHPASARRSGVFRKDRHEGGGGAEEKDRERSRRYATQRCETHHRHRIGKGRRGQIHRRREPRMRAGAAGV